VKIGFIVTIAWCIGAGAAFAAPAQPNRTAVTAALREYLAKQGNFCLGKFDWPIDVSERDFQLGTRDAVQMPVLEKLGLVVASEASVIRRTDDTEETVAVRRYALTKSGERFYLKREIARTTPDGQKIVHGGDFCAAKLSLNRLIQWDESTIVGSYEETTAKYTYKITPASWTRDEEIRRVFPMIDRIIRGEGTLQLQQRLRLVGKSWVAVNAVE
jgi:hypothetical protein